MDWQPQEQGLRDLLTVLEQSRSTDNVAQQQAAKALQTFNALPDFNKYLCYLLCTPVPGVAPDYRLVAGYVLVTNLRSRFLTFPPDTTEYIKARIFEALQDEQYDIRKAAGTITTWLLRSVVPENWPQGLLKLLELLESPNIDVQISALSTFSKVCQDIPKALERARLQPDQPFLNYLVPILLSRMDHDNPRVRSEVLTCLVPFIEPVYEHHPPNAFAAHIDVFVQGLFKRASDPSAAVRKQVCTAMVALLSSQPTKLLPELNGVVDYILHCTREEDKELALEACEFWLTFAEDPELINHLQPYLSQVAPVLLNCTVYDADELFAVGGMDDDEDDANVPDRAEDIKPQHYGGKAHTQQVDPTVKAAQGGSAGPDTNGADQSGANDEDEDEDDYDDDDDDDDDFSEWTLRKCAAAALDVMATAYEADLMNILLPHLKDKLWSSDWLQRESGILTLGAMAEGCITHLSQHLPILIPYLIETLNDSKPLVRSIACWTLGRYSSWLIAEHAGPDHKQAYFVPALEALLRMLLDNNKKVQEAGCSAFATLEEEAGSELDPFLRPVLQNLVFAFAKYQQKNLLILYDAIGTLADAVGDSLNNPELIEVLMPPLIAKWQRLQDDDPDLIPLLECMSSVVVAVGTGFTPYTQPVFARCVQLVQQTLMNYQQHVQNPTAFEEPDKTFIVVALDLLSGLTQGLGPSIASLYEQANPQVFQLLLMCLQYPDPSVRQSAYALLGDCAISVFPLIKTHLPEMMPLMTQQIEPEPKAEFVSVTNNAVWAAGELALKLERDCEPYVNTLMQRLVPILLSNKAARSLAENSAVTIGRLGLVCPQLVAPHLEMFVRHWCSALAEIKDNDEKDSAFKGICMVIQANPSGVMQNFPFFLNAVARWQRPSQELNGMFQTILTAYKANLGDQWTACLGSMPVPIQTRISERYGV